MKNEHNFTEEFSLNVHSEWPLPEYQQFFPYKISKFKETPIENKWEGLIIYKKTNFSALKLRNWAFFVTSFLLYTLTYKTITLLVLLIFIIY
ncbi:hypothetical protein CN354_00395 [Bacillus cereus]|nr:hypothetical protein CN354_00395 [Bacillus cereus]